MERDGFPDVRIGLFDGVAGGDAAGKVGNVRREISGCPLDDDCVAHAGYLLIRACLKMLLRVPGAKSSLGLPETVTRPPLDECLN